VRRNEAGRCGETEGTKKQRNKEWDKTRRIDLSSLQNLGGHVSDRDIRGDCISTDISIFVLELSERSLTWFCYVGF